MLHQFLVPDTTIGSLSTVWGAATVVSTLAVLTAHKYAKQVDYSPTAPVVLSVLGRTRIERAVQTAVPNPRAEMSHFDPSVQAYEKGSMSFVLPGAPYLAVDAFDVESNSVHRFMVHPDTVLAGRFGGTDGAALARNLVMDNLLRTAENRLVRVDGVSRQPDQRSVGTLDMREDAYVVRSANANPLTLKVE